jgi:hypothetical protein
MARVHALAKRRHFVPVYGWDRIQRGVLVGCRDAGEGRDAAVDFELVQRAASVRDEGGRVPLCCHFVFEPWSGTEGEVTRPMASF